MPAQHSETELKLLAPVDFQLPDLTGRAGVASIRALDPQRLSARYYDTADLRLLSSGITFRRRTGEPGGVKWTLKLPAGREDMRTEIDFPGAATRPPAEALEILFGVAGGQPLQSIAGLKTDRDRAMLVADDGAEIAEIVDDRVTISNGTRTAGKFHEIEIEAVGGDGAQLSGIAKVIGAAGAKPEQKAKFARAVEAIYGQVPSRDGLAVPGPEDPATSAVRPMLAAALKRLLANDPHTRLGDPEGVHQLRVGGRRLRSVIRTFGPLLNEGRVTKVVDELRWFGGVAGAVRDLDVLIITLQRESGDAALQSVLNRLAMDRRAAFSELMNALRTKRYLGLIDRVDKLIAEPKLTVATEESCDEALPPLVDRAWSKLKKAARQLTPASPSEDFHRVRILAKRARYAGESVAQFTNSQEQKRLSTLAGYAEAVQNILGEQQDAYFAIGLLQRLAAERPNAGAYNLEMGRLIERQYQKADRQAAAFFDAWRKLERKQAG